VLFAAVKQLAEEILVSTLLTLKAEYSFIYFVGTQIPRVFRTEWQFTLLLKTFMGNKASRHLPGIKFSEM
jgi:hypothetical protein